MSAYPYSFFGFSLWRLRESRSKSTAVVAKYLNIETSEYRKFEKGERLPSNTMLLQLSQILKHDVTILKQWVVYGSRKKSKGKATEGALAYTAKLEEAIVRIDKNMIDLTGRGLDRSQKKALKRLIRKIPQIVFLPVLPMNFILIHNAVFSDDVMQFKYLHQVPNFILPGETLAGFISRDFYFGLVIFYLANLFKINGKTYDSVEECLNNLTVLEFQQLFLIATYEESTFEVAADIPKLQQHVDFSSLTTLFARELEKELGGNVPKDINFNHLQMALLLQAVGHYVLFDRIKPAILNRGEEIIEDHDEAGDYVGFDKKLFLRTLWEAHAPVAATIGANLNLPKEVLEIISTHHDHPSEKVSPTCALLKVVNFFVDKDFPMLSKDEIEELLEPYPQIKIPTQALYEITNKLASSKDELFERSSSALEDSDVEIAKFIRAHVQKLKNDPAINMLGTDQHLAKPLKRSDFRFDPVFQSFLLNIADSGFKDLVREYFSPRRDENYDDFAYRSANFHIRLQYALTKDLNEVANKSGLSLDRVKEKLKL